MELYLITGNSGKFREMKGHMEGTGIHLVQDDSPFTEVQSDTLEGVVLFGIEDFVQRNGTDRTVMKDDSGLFIASLNGFPGVYSAYVLRTLGCGGILRLMEGMSDRRAYFRTAIGLFRPGYGTFVYRGEVHGAIAHESSGRSGFGFDPIFVPEGMDRTFAEMTLEEKNSMSHRTRALDPLLKDLLGDLG